MEGSVEPLEGRGASPSDAHPTLHKDQPALLCKEDKVKEKDG